MLDTSPPPRSHTPAPQWPYFFTTLAPLALFAPFLLGQRVLYWGAPLLQFYPWRKFALDAIRAGHLPLWNPYLGNGAPLIANYQSAIFYPPNWLSLLLPLDYSLSWLAVLHLIWAGAGMVTLARALGLHPLGQAVAGLAFGLSQYLVARVGFLSINAAAAWLPWVIWSAERLLTADTRPPIRNTQYALLLSLFLSLQLLAGHAQTTWYTLLALGAWVVWRTLSQPRPLLSSVIRHSSFVILSVALAFGLASLQLLPTAELLRQSPRAAAADYEFVATYSFSPWRLLTLLTPDLLGNPARSQFYGYGNYWEDAIYVGVLPLLLALAVILRSLASMLRRLVRIQPLSSKDSSAQSPAPLYPHAPALPHFLAIILLVSLLFALGRNTPIFPFLYRHVPTFDLFQAPTRMMILFVFALALLAGLGADRWQRPEGRALYWTRLGAAGAAAVFLTSLVALFIIPPASRLALQLLTVARALALAGVGLFISALLSLLKPATRPLVHTPRQPHAWELALILFLSADLLLANYALNPGAAPDLYRKPTASGATLALAMDGHRLFQFPDDEYHVRYERLFSFQNFGPPGLAQAAREAQLPNTALLDGLASSNNFEPLVSARYAGLLEVVSATRSLNLLRLMDVSVVASSATLDWERVASGMEGVHFYRLPGQPRRVWVVYSDQTIADAAAARAALAAPDFDPGTTVILEADDPGAFPYAAPFPSTSLTASPNAVTIPVSLDRPGWVVLSDTYYPGWAAFVDGQPARLLHADYAFRAVAVGQGEHVLEFRYQPRSFQIGLWISGLSWLAWLGAAMWAWRRSR